MMQHVHVGRRHVKLGCLPGNYRLLLFCSRFLLRDMLNIRYLLEDSVAILHQHQP